MAQYTDEAFRWTGTYYNAQYNTSYTATFDDNDAGYNGGGDGSETVSINGGSFNSTSGSPYDIRVSFTDAGGVAHVENFYFFNTGGAWYFVPGPGSAFTVGATLGSYQSHTVGWNYTDVLCFMHGSRIETRTGLINVEDLRPGDQVLCGDGSYKTLRLNMRSAVSSADLYRNPKLRPVTITAGALGHGLPLRDLHVSRQHRMVVQSKISERMFGHEQVLVAAIRLTALPGIYVNETIDALSYHHLVFAAHEVIYAEGALSESLYCGAQSLGALSQACRAEVFALFPDMDKDMATNQSKGRAATPMKSALPIPKTAQQKNLAARHAKNNHAVLSSAMRA